eukprot:554012-Amphidinium_carterae.1
MSVGLSSSATQEFLFISDDQTNASMKVWLSAGYLERLHAHRPQWEQVNPEVLHQQLSKS